MTLPALPSLSQVRQQLTRVNTERDHLTERILSLRKEIAHLENESELLDFTQAALRTLIDQEVLLGVKAVEARLTDGLQAVFSDQNLRVEAEVSISRGKVSVDLVTIHSRGDGQVIRGSTGDAFGGALAALESVLLRILVLRRRGLRMLLLLDESLPAFDPTYTANVGEFLRVLCEELQMDILLVSHNPVMAEAAHRAYRVRQTRTGAQYELLRKTG